MAVNNELTSIQQAVVNYLLCRPRETSEEIIAAFALTKRHNWTPAEIRQAISDLISISYISSKTREVYSCDLGKEPK